MTIQNIKNKTMYAIFATIVTVSLLLASTDVNITSHAALAAPTQTIPGPVFPPTPEFTDTEMQQFLTDAKSIPGVNAWSDKWQINYVDYAGTMTPDPKWDRMIMHLYISPTTSAPKSCDIGWESIIEFDLGTRKVTSSFYPTNDTACHRGVVKLGDPEANMSQVTTSNWFVPTASAVASQNSWSVATMEDVLNTSDSIQGSIADVLTPTFSGSYAHMDGFVGQLLNLRFSPTVGVNYAQSGWIIAKSGCTGSCGDLVLPNTKSIVWADSSVAPFNVDAHVFTTTWVNGQTETVEVLCNGGSNYKVQAAYAPNLWQHNTNIPCTSKAQGGSTTNSIFFENGNTVASSNWSGDITSTVRATNANELLNGSWTSWQNSKDIDIKYIDAACNKAGVDPSLVMTGNVKLGGTATWSTLANVPKGCV